MTRRYRPSTTRKGADREEAGRGEPGTAAPRREPTLDEQREALTMYAFRALGQRALSEAELRRRMQRRSENAELIEGVLTRVRDLGFLSDEQVAQAEARRRGVGTGRVRQKLRQRGVESGVIEEALAARDPDDEAEDARALLDRRWSSFQRAANPQKRAFDFLMRRGYPSSLIWPLLREKGLQQEFEDSEAED